MRSQYFDAKESWLKEQIDKNVPLGVRRKGGRTLRRYLAKHCEFMETPFSSDEFIEYDLAFKFKGKVVGETTIKVILKEEEDES